MFVLATVTALAAIASLTLEAPVPAPIKVEALATIALRAVAKAPLKRSEPAERLWVAEIRSRIEMIDRQGFASKL